MMRFIENQQYSFKAQGYSVGTSKDIHVYFSWKGWKTLALLEDFGNEQLRRILSAPWLLNHVKIELQGVLWQACCDGLGWFTHSAFIKYLDMCVYIYTFYSYAIYTLQIYAYITQPSWNTYCRMLISAFLMLGQSASEHIVEDYGYWRVCSAGRTVPWQTSIHLSSCLTISSRCLINVHRGF